jgi:magnesium-protoporphyrin IX monomethyl ester (oxidative) cyclase
MNILLIQPPITVKKNEAFAVTPPLSLAYLAAVAEQIGHRVRILDTIVEGFNFRKNQGRLVRIGLPEEEIKREIEAFQPDLVGITCPFSLMDKEMRRVASLVKNVNPDILVVVGGAHPSSMPEYVIQDCNIDFVVLGEGEETFLELIKKIDAGTGFLNVRGLFFKKDGKIIKNSEREFIADLDSVPFPAWHLLSIEKYIELGQAHGSQRRKRYAPMVTSRGCPGKCVFCSIHSVWGYQWRARSPENVVEEIEELVSDYKIREIHFEDDNLTLSRQRMIKICDLIVERGLDISWTTPNGVAVNTLDSALLEKMKKSGCYQLNFGIESGDPNVLKNIIHKPLSLDRVRKVVDYSKKLGIWTHGFFVIGFPGESAESVQRTIDFAKEVDLDSANFFIAAPYPGTPLNDLASSEGLIKKDFDLSKLRTMDASIDTKQFKAKELVVLQKKAYLEFINYRLKREIIQGYFIVRFFKSHSPDDIAFLMQKIRERVIPTLSINTSK